PCGGDGDCLPLHTCAEGACVRVPEAACDDGADEDGDGATDCADADCAGRPCAGGGVCALGACLLPPQPACGPCASDSDCLAGACVALADGSFCLDACVAGACA